MSSLAFDLPGDLGGDAPQKTLQDLIGILRNRGDARNTTRFPDSYLTSELQAAFSEGYELIVQINEGFFDQQDTITTVAHQNYIALPAGPTQSWIVRAIDLFDSGDWVPVPRIGIKDRNRYGQTEGRPNAHRLTARGIDLYPTPDQVYTLRVTHTPSAPQLDVTPRDYYNSWEEYTIYGALVRLYDTQGRDSSQWQRQLERTAARIVKAASSRDSSGPEYLNLREGFTAELGGEDPDRWRPGF